MQRFYYKKDKFKIRGSNPFNSAASSRVKLIQQQGLSFSFASSQTRIRSFYYTRIETQNNSPLTANFFYNSSLVAAIDYLADFVGQPLWCLKDDGSVEILAFPDSSTPNIYLI